MPTQDTEKLRAQRRRHYQRHKTRLDAKSKAWRQANPERARAIGARSVRKNYAGRLVTNARNRARKKGLEFAITAADVRLVDRCPVFGFILDYEGGKGGKPKPNSPSLDRVDPKIGYVPSNIHVISWRANTLKNDATPEEIAALARYLQVFG